MVAKPLCPLYKNIIKHLDRARYPELRYKFIHYPLMTAMGSKWVLILTKSDSCAMTDSISL